MNPCDNKIQKGMLRPFLPHKFPFIPDPGLFLQGYGSSANTGVTNFKAGDKVVSYLGMTGGGGLAEYVVANQRSTAHRPPEVSAAEAAALPIAACTAYQALAQEVGLKLDGSWSQKNVLITGASGGVGHYAVQLAKLGNTHVTATCGARNIELVKSLDADEVLDYNTPEGAALKSPSGKKYDIVLECATGTRWSTFKHNLSERAIVLDLTPTLTSFTTAVIKKVTFSKQKLVQPLVAPNPQDLDVLLKLIKEGKIKTWIDSKYPLSKAEDAWVECIGGHATGKIIVEP